MAKTFKNLPPPETALPAKRASERDFFDLIDDSQPAATVKEMPDDNAIPVSSTVADIDGNHQIAFNTGNIHNTSNTGKKKRLSTPRRVGRRDDFSNTGIIDNTGNIAHTGNPDNLIAAANTGMAAPRGNVRDVRQTFVLSQGHLEKLRDHVHARRIGGDYNYSQKQALQEALDLLFASTAPISPRPEQVRELEQQRRERIKAGRISQP